ncbi:MAG: hypothetical protein RJA70_4523 [Pseudomonadota bacterium]|jgi:ABC-type transporter Mla subunit MlaD
MPVGSNHWKLGLFVVVVVSVTLSVALLLGLRTWSGKTTKFVSYFDESVQGLALGSSVKYRGVTVGRVVDIDIASDLRHVQVTGELSAELAGELNLAALDAPQSVTAQPDLRAQLAQTGITGVRFISIDFFDPETTPRPHIPFEPLPNHIPTAPSMMKNLEDSMVQAVDRLPQIADDAALTMQRIRSVAEQVESGNLPKHANETLDQAERALSALTSQLNSINAAALSESTARSLTMLSRLLERSDALLSRIEGENGLLTNAERGIIAISEVAKDARMVGPELELTLREVRGASRSIKRLADSLERDPDMLLKGRSR